MYGAALSSCSFIMQICNSTFCVCLCSYICVYICTLNPEP